MPNWKQVVQEIENTNTRLQQQAEAAIDVVRRKYMKQLHGSTGRNIIAYYSGWLTNPELPGADVNDEDKNAFMMAIHGLDKSLGLDLLLHTPGGGIAAAESLVDYLHRMFGSNIRAIVPQIAMSAGTMIACACNSIVLAKHSNLGPIDPQIGGLPAAAVKKEIERAVKEIDQDRRMLHLWQFVLSKYSPTFVGQCEQAVEWAQDFVRRMLEENMFSGDADKAEKAARVVKALSDIDENKAHSRHIHIDACMGMGLKIERLEDDPKFQDAVLTVHHCYMHSIATSGAAKIVENHEGAAFIKAPV
ncbi:SDH family Clp fold serine proteinase [Faunimonas sp. B44]|uniref:SDH family Clp fold serine proteinase n=1 Tax=Faunimonas sp. B44 TaxID=3461493 RepID=UPI00404413AA